MYIVCNSSKGEDILANGDNIIIIASFSLVETTHYENNVI
jgi:hypothetical protein